MLHDLNAATAIVQLSDLNDAEMVISVDDNWTARTVYTLIDVISGYHW